ncbi:MAG: WD40 repeat domain-containing protein [Candidatus Promineifilaceae bacterium]
MPQVARALSSTYGQAMCNKSSFYVAELPHKAEVTAVTCSADGQKIVTASRDRTVKLWSGEGNHLKTLRDHADVVHQVAFAPDGAYFVTVSDDRTAIIWDHEGNLHHRITGHDAAALRVAISQDSEFIATGEAGGNVNLWDRQGHLMANLDGHKSAISHITFAPDGGTLFSASLYRTAKIWKALPPQQRTFRHKGEVVPPISCRVRTRS